MQKLNCVKAAACGVHYFMCTELTLYTVSGGNKVAGYAESNNASLNFQRKLQLMTRTVRVCLRYRCRSVSSGLPGVIGSVGLLLSAQTWLSQINGSPWQPEKVEKT